MLCQAQVKLEVKVIVGVEFPINAIFGFSWLLVTSMMLKGILLTSILRTSSFILRLINCNIYCMNRCLHLALLGVAFSLSYNYNAATIGSVGKRFIFDSGYPDQLWPKRITQFLGSMLPQYMALCVCLYVTLHQGGIFFLASCELR